MLLNATHRWLASDFVLLGKRFSAVCKVRTVISSKVYNQSIMGLFRIFDALCCFAVVHQHFRLLCEFWGFPLKTVDCLPQRKTGII